MSEEEIPGRIIPAGTKVWTEDEIIDKVFAFDGGCNPGRVAWLKTLGINVDGYGKKAPVKLEGTSKVVVTAEVTVDWSEWMTWYMRNYDDYTLRSGNQWVVREWSAFHQFIRQVLTADYSNVKAVKKLERTYEVTEVTPREVQ